MHGDYAAGLIYLCQVRVIIFPGASILVAVIHGVSETGSGFRVEWPTAWEVKFLFFRSFLASVDKILILAGGLGAALVLRC